jgi:AraC-like DNA-binding protein
MMAICLVVFMAGDETMEAMLIQNLRFDYVEGGSTPVKSPHTTGWRQFPCWVIVAPAGNGVYVETHRHGKLFCKAGDAVLVTPNLAHCFSVKNRGNYISHWCHAHFTLPGDIDVADFLETPLIVGPPISRQIKQINAEMALLKNIDQRNSIKLASRHLELGFSLLAKIGKISREKSGQMLFGPGVERIRELLIYIDQHLHEELERNALADWAGLSAARFHVVFGEVVGLSPMNFVKRQRMKKAQVLLSETHQNINHICRSVGYPDPYTFSRAFKNTVGISPRTYRERSKKMFSE